LKSPAKIALSVWKGLISVDAEGIIDETPVDTATQDTVRIGKELHIAVVRLALSTDKLLEWGQLYSYNLKFTTSDNQSGDFKSLGLLEVSDIKTGHTAVSYQADLLPGFAMPAKELEKLKILHGSCRNNDNRFEDSLSYVDDLIKENLADPNGRPQQLFLSGDQIYADSVVGTLLHHLTGVGFLMLDKKETLPTSWPDESSPNRWPADTQHFPAFIRRRLIDSEARFTSGDTANHLISFGEYAAMYLSVWCDSIWPDIAQAEHFEEVFHSMVAVPENYGAIFRRKLFDERTGDREVFEDGIMEKCLAFLLTLQDKAIRKTILTNKGTEEQLSAGKTALKNFLDTAATLEERQKLAEFITYLKEWIGPAYPTSEEDSKKDGVKLKIFLQTLPKVRRALANVSTFMIFDDHEITDDWNLNPSWRDRVFTSPLGKSIIRNGMLAYALFQDWGNQADRYNRKGHFFEMDKNLAGELEAGQLTDTLKVAFTDNNITLDKEKVVIKTLHTDEWLLENRENKDEFLIRKYKKNAGSDEEVLIVVGNAHAHLVEKIAALFQDDTADINALEDHIDFLLGLDFQHRVQGPAGGRQQLPDNRSPLIKWHYSYEGVKHKVLVIDNRTRRSFVNFDGAPGNLSFNGMTDLIPVNPDPKDDEVLFVVAPLPVLGPSVLDELIAPLAYKAFDLKDYFAGGNAVKEGMMGTNPDAIEAWTFDPVSQEELLKRLAPFKKIIFLSGDVHYSSSQRLCYWIKGKEKAVACFAQLTSSGFRNIMPSYIQSASQHFLNAQKLVRQNIRAERLGWHDHKLNPKPIKLPDKSKSSFLKDKLGKSPVIIPVNGWPEGTETGREPDWAWRIENVLDLRKEEARPLPTRMDAIEESDDLMATLRKVAQRHIAQAKKVNFTRQILFKTNLGVVTFARAEGGPREVHHTLFAVPADGKPETLQKHEIYTQHKIALEASEEEKAPKLPVKKP
jgi:hypothetical protein